MSKLLFFVTSILIALNIPAGASPQDQMPDASGAWPAAPDTPLGDDMSVVTPPPRSAPPPPPEARYYTYQQAFTFRVGASGLFPADKFEDKVVGFQYLFPKFLSPKMEAGADLHDNGNGHLHVGARWYYFERSFFRPSVKVGLDHLVDSSEGLATFTHLDNYYLRTSATLEYVVWDPYSLRLEPELLWGTKNVIGEVTLGLSRGW